MIKTPLPDTVFQTWIKSKNSKEIEKVFGRKASEISPMEVVGAEIQKSPALIFKSSTQVDMPKGKDDGKLYNYLYLQKQDFFKFKGQIAQNDWKRKEVIVNLYSKIDEKTCGTCKGKGAEVCRDCNGAGKKTCDYCKNDKNLICDSCKGKKNITFVVNVYDEKDKREKIERSVNCPKCHGKGSIGCRECGGTKTVVCSRCRGTGEDRVCKECEGTGKMYRLPQDPVPLAGGTDFHIFFNPALQKQMGKSKKMKNKELIDLMAQRNIVPIVIKDLKQLNQKELEPQLGFWDKSASGQIKDTIKAFESLKKDKASNPQFPIEIYPVQKIDIETYVKKKFSIYSMGSENGFITFDLGF